MLRAFRTSQRSKRTNSRLSFEPLEPRQLLAITTLAPEADTYTRAGVNAGSAAVLALDVNGQGDHVVYVRFDVSGIDLETFDSVKLKLFKTAGTRNDTIVEDRFDVYGLLPLAGNTPQDWDEATLAEGNVGRSTPIRAAMDSIRRGCSI